MNASLPWPASYRDSPVETAVSVPGSKSLTNRALILASLADGPSILHRPLGSRDTNLMAAALTALGATIDTSGPDWAIRPISEPPRMATIDCGLAGTVMRFVPPIAALGAGAVRFDGDERARQRPMSTTIESLRALGVRIDDDGRGALPFTVHGAGAVAGGPLAVDASASSQFVSALLLVGSQFTDGLDLVHTGPPLPSLPHVDMTVAELRRRGVRIDQAPDHWAVAPGRIEATDAEIEPDLSNAGVFIAAALVTGGRMRVRNWPERTDQAGDAWRSLTVAFGGEVQRDGADLVFAGGPQLRGVDLDLHEIGELTPVIAAIAALADEPSRLTGIAHLRGHETDRLTALATEINRMGGAVHELDDGLAIEPRPLRGGLFRTYDDHRMAHAAVVLGLRVKDVYVENIETTAKTYPSFAPVWERLVAP
jgi:3-phosphoshikimate 1-carboxyvinyltransferase